MKSISLPPYAPILMESTRAIGYSIESAIADIIDNSVSANSSRVDIDFFPIGEAYISILDNGWGMSSDEITNAMQYGSKSPHEVRDVTDLGRYGLGLKTASLSQCRKLTVVSKKGGEISGRQWDLDHIIEEEDWSLNILEEKDMSCLPSIDKLNEEKSGTLVIWQNLDKFSIGESDITLAFSKKIELVRDHLALVFHRYLNGELGLQRLNIRINDRPIIGKDPFLVKKSTQLMDDEIITVHNQKVVIKPFILPHISKLSEKELKELGGKEGLRRNQGFYVYRNKRMLIWGTWFRLMRKGDLSKLARVMVDIPNSLDDLWTLDIKKSTAVPPEEVRINLSNVINKITDGSKRTWTYRGKKEQSDSSIHLWNRITTRDDAILYVINRDYPLVDGIIAVYPQLKIQMDTLLSQIESTLPLNSLFMDLTNDEKIANETIYNDSTIINLLRSILTSYDSETSQTMVENLLLADPFCEYEIDIRDAIEKGELL